MRSWTVTLMKNLTDDKYSMKGRTIRKLHPASIRREKERESERESERERVRERE